MAVRTPAGRALTYADLDLGSGRLAVALRDAGVRTGDRVAVQVAKSPDAVLLHLALLRCGAVQLPVSPAYTAAELTHLLSDSGTALVVHDPATPPPAGPWHAMSAAADGTGSLADAVGRVTADPGAADVAAGPDDPAALLYTSGTTGRPKGALLSQRNLAHNARVLVEAWGFGPGDVLLHVLPLHHTHGLFVALHCALASGSVVLLADRFDAEETVALLPSATVLMGVPTHYTRLLGVPGFGPASVAGLRLMTSGSAPMTVDTHRLVFERTGLTVLERYGMTETSMLTSNPLVGERRAGTVGRPLPGVSVRVAGPGDRPLTPGEVGALQVRGPNVFAGYWGRPELTATEFTADGWFRTGDLGSFDGDGYLTLAGRAKDLVISGGLNVYPKEVEAALDALPGVAESAVVGVPDEDLGEAVVAFVVPELPGAVLDPQALRDGARAVLAGFKVPRSVVVVEELPRNAMGKVEKARLRASLS